MDELIRIILPIYFFVYFGQVFILKSLMVARRIGKSPLVFPRDNSAFSLIGFYFKMTLSIMLLYVLAFSFFPEWHNNFLPIIALDRLILKYLGLVFLTVALVWSVIAQANMNNSWRMGIDKVTKTDLVTTGLFTYSRNPVFLGMILCLTGLFMITPNALTGLFLILCYMLIQIQIRLEEEFLTKEHGQKYLEYKQRVRRFIYCERKFSQNQQE